MWVWGNGKTMETAALWFRVLGVRVWGFKGCGVGAFGFGVYGL